MKTIETIKISGVPMKLGWLDREAGLAKDLQDAVCASLGENEQEFLLPKSFEYFESMQGKLGITIGAMTADGKLIGKSTLSFPENDWDDNGMKELSLPIKNSEMAVVEAQTILPAFQGLGLGQKMTAHLATAAMKCGRPHFVAQVHADNGKNCHILSKCGMIITKAFPYPDDQSPVYYLYKGTMIYAGAECASAKFAGAFEIMKSLLAAGYVAKVANDKIIWHRCKVFMKGH